MKIRLSPRPALTYVTLATLLITGACATTPPYARDQDLALRLTEPVCWTSNSSLLVPYAVTNVSSFPVRLGQYPGISLWASCTDDAGVRHSAIIPGLLISGLSSSAFPRFVLVLPPGVSQVGLAPVWLPSVACSTNIRVEGGFTWFGNTEDGFELRAITPSVHLHISAPLILQRPPQDADCPILWFQQSFP